MNRILIYGLVLSVVLILFYQFVWLRLVVLIQGRRPMSYKKAWVVDNRFRAKYVPKYLDWCELRPGDRVLDLGCGPGAFVPEASKRVGKEGKVYAIDIQQEMIDLVQEKIDSQSLTNVVTHVAGAEDLPLATDSVDHAYLVTVLTEVPDTEPVLAELRRVIRPGGQLSIMEEFGDPDWVRSKTSRAWVTDAGFEFEQQNGSWYKYHLRFRVPSGEGKQEQGKQGAEAEGSGKAES
ncbi:MAG: methyltransferase domain-containing protein [Holophagales bacterium]|nr:methyltransferase domain-containing protein [Holophagales bacterium]